MARDGAMLFDTFAGREPVASTFCGCGRVRNPHAVFELCWCARHRGEPDIIDGDWEALERDYAWAYAQAAADAVAGNLDDEETDAPMIWREAAE